ncbi:aryl-alcohol dehydrogenase-like predicted oxidoreductase [Glaciihabitans tibetensis]|uniref:Aryl-alcohol dehydrogenase-like predicted oxidoreductase n=1 Tax=Glaciihabitans tibetensis TaxID=1266600 RepID=A0A2T0VFI8_9MICO|nr:aldo/keto reductase [Glaciihabitans tibetensis]PRY68965.1 aryl-alcohol dehydrogenase-like predicted oxidoreductase [Glaciihabitans tibetensis]
MTTHTDTSARPADASGSFSLGGDLPITRLGYGTMQLTGPGVWGEPDDRANAIRVIRRAAELGVNFFDSADAYGPAVTDGLLREALQPYADDIVIATKVGQTRQGPGSWIPVGQPAYLRQQVEMALRHLDVERIDLLQLHRIDPTVALEDQIGELGMMQTEGKIRHIGISQVTIAEAEAAQKVAPIASVQNLFNLTDRSSEDLLDWSAERGIAFIPWFPLATGALSGEGSPLTTLAAEHNATPSQLALAWLLRRSPAMVPIPGTSSVSHLEDNLAGATIDLTDAEFEALSAITE